MPNTPVAALLLSTLCLFTPPLVAQESHAKFATLTFENDIFVGDDGGYTNGFGLTFGEGAFDTFDSHNTPTWILWLTQDSYINTMDYKRRGISYTLFQRMQTPQNIETRTLIEDDVPYAGILAWHSSMYAWDDQVTDQLKLFAGVIGPISYAEETQSLVHSVTGSEQPQGWDNQLRNELVFRIAAHRVWSLYRSQGDGLQFEVVGVGGISAGTLESSAKVGGAIRWGNNLAASFPTFSLDADREINPLGIDSVE